MPSAPVAPGMQTAIQLYTLRDVERPYLELLGEVADAGFDGVEFAYRVDEADAAAVRDTLDAEGLAAAAAHVPLEDVEADFETVAERARQLGYEDLVVPWLEPEHFESVAAVEATAERLDDLAEAATAAGLRLHYHNHDQEFADTEQGTAFHVLAELTDDLLFEFDAGWALAAGIDPVDMLRQYGDRITLVHAKDVALDDGPVSAVDFEPEDLPPLGEGDLDVEAVVDAAREIDAEWLIYESDEPDDPETAHEHGADVLSRFV